MRKGTLIPPIPKEYLTYSDGEKIEKTEKYYQKIKNLYCRMNSTEGDYTTRLNQLLLQDVSSKEIFDIFVEKEAQILCLYDYKFYVLKILAQIAEKEEAFNVQTLLHNVHSTEDAICWYQRCVFLLRRFEFDWEEDDELFLLVQEKKVSYIALAEIIRGEGSVRKVHTGSQIAQYLYGRGLKREALLFLVWLEKQIPYSERKIMVFAMTLLELGEQQLAYEILMKHKNPDVEIKSLQMELAKVL